MYIAGDDNVVDVLLFAVERCRRDDFELVTLELDQLERGAGLVVKATADAGVRRAVAVRHGYVCDKHATHRVLRHPRQTIVTAATLLGALRRIDRYRRWIIVDI